jgi:soluble lytic murein transglycosylase-like protein
MEDNIPSDRYASLLKYAAAIVFLIVATFSLSVLSEPTTSSHLTDISSGMEGEVERGSETDADVAVYTVSIENSKAEQLFHPIIKKAADRYGVEVALIKAVIMVESRYNPNAVSRKGAKGLMQLMPRTAEALGVKDSFNPETNVNAGVRYLRKLMNRYDGNTKLALAAYNAGMGHVRYYDGIPPFRATRFYIDKVFRYYRYYKDNDGREVSDA